MAPGGVYLGVDGPRRETAAEARMYRIWGADVLGQNLVPEIALARELGLCFAGLVTIDEISAERPPPPTRREDHRGLEAVVQALSAFLQSGDENVSCDCAPARNCSGAPLMKITQLFEQLELYSEGDPPSHSLFVLARAARNSR